MPTATTWAAATCATSSPASTSSIAERLVDPNRQFVYGVSYGGFMTSWLVGHTHQFRAAVAAERGDRHERHVGTERPAKLDRVGVRRPAVGSRRGDAQPQPAGTMLDEVHTPTLILHSRDDRRCPLRDGPDVPPGAAGPRRADANGRSIPTKGTASNSPGTRWTCSNERWPGSPPTISARKQKSSSWEIRSPRGFDRALSKRKPSPHSSKADSPRPAGRFAPPTRASAGSVPTRRWPVWSGTCSARRPLVVTIMYGTNDSYVDPGRDASRLPLDKYRENLARLVEQVRASGVRADPDD